jgi:hypothetical protein
MLIDKQNGQLSINLASVFYPNMRTGEFTSKSDIDLWQIIVNNEVYRGFTRDLIDYEGRKINVQVVFAKSCLKIITLSFFLPGGKT